MQETQWSSSQWYYDSDTSDDDDTIGLTNNIAITTRRRRNKYHSGESTDNRFCYAMILLLVLGIGFVTGLFVAISKTDIETPLTPIISFGSVNNNNKTSHKKGLRRTTDDNKEIISPYHIITSTSKPSLVDNTFVNGMDGEWVDILSNDYNTKFSGYILNLKNKVSEIEMENANILTKIVIDDYSIPFIYQHSNLWNIQYPFSKDDNYKSNENRQWCFHFYLFNYNSAQIDIQFKSFQLERGFDRILIHHYNQSFMDPPTVISGRGPFNEDEYRFLIPDSVSYSIFKNEFKSICIELQTDDTINLSGIAFSVSVRYDHCLWNDWDDCYVEDTRTNEHQCRIGVHHRVRDVSDDIVPNGMVDCPKGSCILAEFCKQGLCQDVNTQNNSVQQLDPVYADLFRVYSAHPSTPEQFDHITQVKDYMSDVMKFRPYPLYDISDDSTFNIEYILKQLKSVKLQIINEHLDESVLVISSQKISTKTMIYLGARLTHSLLIGRTFTLMFAGIKNNIVGDENQFSYSYPMQLQSRLRQLWQKIGFDGAAFAVRNVAIRDHINRIYMTRYMYDMIFWEYSTVSKEQIELQIRLTALLDGIYCGMISIQNHCQLQETQNINTPGIDECIKRYEHHMGMIQFDLRHQLDAVCDKPEYRNIKSFGHKIVADIIAYKLIHIAIGFLNNYKNKINDMTRIELNQWLKALSGDWRAAYISNRGFPKPIFCESICDQTIVPFVLNSFEPNVWNTNFRLSDYIYNDYDSRNKGFKINDLTTLEQFGWDFKDFNPDRLHYPLDKAGNIGTMDRRNAFVPNREFFKTKFEEFMSTQLNSDDNNQNINNNLRKYNEEFSQFMRIHDFVLKIVFLIPDIGSHSFIIVNNQYYGDSSDNMNIYDLFLLPIYDKEQSSNLESNYQFDFNESIFKQRNCTNGSIIGCHILRIPPGKYILTIIPKNLLFLSDDTNDSIFAISSVIGL